jgi:hypothetical protein
VNHPDRSTIGRLLRTAVTVVIVVSVETVVVVAGSMSTVARAPQALEVQRTSAVTGQDDLGGGLVGSPAASSWAANRVDVFVRGLDDQLFHRWWDGGAWQGWEPLGGVLTSAPAVASWGPNRLDVFVRGTDGQLYHRWWDGAAWQGWEPLGGVLTSAPAVASWGGNRLDVVVEGADNALWTRTWAGPAGWSIWSSLGGPGSPLRAEADPAAASWAAGRIDVAVVDQSGRVHRRAFNGRWGDWVVEGSGATSSPALSSWAPGRLDLFWRSTGGSAAHAWIDLPPFRSSVRAVSAAELWASWRPGCPVGPDELRLVEVDTWGFDGLVTPGAIVVHWTVAELLRQVLYVLFTHGFPINRLAPVESNGGSDDAVMAANTSSGFNCRAVTGGTGWSEHAYGMAVDINPVQNPYVSGSLVLPDTGRGYVDRTLPAAGMITAANPVPAVFGAIGWPWGGNWRSLKDYMHFSATGR